jgi:hypothetical protein
MPRNDVSRARTGMRSSRVELFIPRNRANRERSRRPSAPGNTQRSVRKKFQVDDPWVATTAPRR